MSFKIELTPGQLAALGIAEENPTEERVLEALEAQRTKLSEATVKLQEIEDAKSLAEVEALLADYDLPQESVVIMRDIAKGDRAKAEALLGGMRKKGEVRKAATSHSAGEIPAVVHDFARYASPEQRVEERNKLIAEHVQKFPGSTKKEATEALFRYRPALFEDIGNTQERDREITEYRQKTGATYQKAWEVIRRKRPELFPG